MEDDDKDQGQSQRPTPMSRSEVKSEEGRRRVKSEGEV